MSVKINIPHFLLEHTRGKKVVEVEGKTVEECLGDFIRQFPGIKNEMFDNDGSLSPYLTIWVNRESIYPDFFNKPLEGGEELDILRIYLGG